jgi:hypothetical protein
MFRPTISKGAMDASMLIRQREARTVYANVIVQKERLQSGCSPRIQLDSSSPPTYATNTLATEGAVFTTVEEQEAILAAGACPVPENIPAPTNIRQTAATATGFTLAWIGATGAVSYTFTVNGTAATPTVDLVAKNAIFTGLVIGNTYTVIITAVDVANVGTASTPFTAATTVPVPTGISQSATTSTGFTLAWSGGDGATNYSFTVNGSSASPTVNIGAKTAIFTGLASSGSYSVIINALNVNGFPAASSPFTATTNAAPPTTPTGISQTATTTVGFTLAWSGGDGATGYTFTANGSAVTPTVNVGAKTAVFAALLSGSSYAVIITATNSSGTPVSSSSFTALTAVSAPTSISQSSNTTSGFTLAWSGATNATSYTFTVNGSSASPTVDIAGKTAVFTGLASSSSYTVIINALNANAFPTASSPFTATTAIPPPTTPTGISQTATTTTGFTLAWSGGDGATGYTFTANGAAVTPTVNLGAKTAVFTALLSSSSYAVIITATNASGTPAPSSSFTALTAVPAPTSISQSSNTTSGFTLTWSGAAGATNYSFTVNGAAASPAPTVNVGARTAIFTGLASSSSYTVIVNALNANGFATASSPFTATTAVPAPTTPVVTVTSIGLTSFNISWTGGDGATSYSFVSGGTTYTPTSVSSNTALLSGLTFGALYSSIVFNAINVGGTTGSAPFNVQLYGSSSVLASGFSANGLTDVFVDLSQNILTADNGFSSGIKVVTPAGTVTTVTSTPSLTNPYGVASDATNLMYIANTNANEVAKLTFRGVKTSFVSMNQVRAIRLDTSGNTYTLSFVDNTVLIRTNPAGTKASIISGLTSPAHFSMDATRNIYLAKTNATAVLTKYNHSNDSWTEGTTYTFTGGNIVGAAVSTTGYIAVSLSNNTVQIRSPSGVISNVTGFNLPRALSFNGSGLTLYVADSLNSRIVAITLPPV